MSEKELLAEFYLLSAVLTGFNKSELIGTGVGEEYYNVLIKDGRQDIVKQLLTCYKDSKDICCIMNNEKFGPLARNIIKAWYLSIWYPLKPDWYKIVGLSDPQDKQYVISANAYIQGLVWQSIGSHPMGAKQPGYGSWASRPTINNNLAILPIIENQP